MNVKEFYNAILEIFPREILMVDSFVNPTLNNCRFSGIQFIYPNGAISGALNVHADTVLFNTPLEGPFYRLPVIGAIMNVLPEYDEDDNWWCVRVVVRLPGGNEASSCSIHINEDGDRIRKGIGYLCGNRWYKTTSTAPRNFKYELVQDSII